MTTQEYIDKSPYDLPGFEGDIAWVRGWEGHFGRPYWPGGASGLTLDPGVDLGYIDPTLVYELYIDVLSVETIEMLLEYQGLTGEAARSVMYFDKVKQVRISEEQATSVFPFVAGPYWEDIVSRFPGLKEAPGAVQTAFLSLSINRGPYNSDLHLLSGPLEQKDWSAIANRIDGMQNNHSLRGVTKRRDAEAELVEEAAAKLRNARLQKLSEMFMESGAEPAPLADLVMDPIVPSEFIPQTL